MNDPNAFPWGGVMVMILTLLVVAIVVKVVTKIAEWVISAREWLRERYLEGNWKPAGIDILMVPTWFALEIFCLVVAIVFTLIIGLLMYQAAKDVRDWWHAGGRGRD